MAKRTVSTKPLGKDRGLTDERQAVFNLMLEPRLSENPYNFVIANYPWGQAGTPLAHSDGPRKWQREELLRIGEHLHENLQRMSLRKAPLVYKRAVASGRGVGKSSLFSWLADWNISCHIGSTTIVSANNEAQLTGVTWGELSKWRAMALNKDFFVTTATSVLPAKWFTKAVEDQLRIGAEYYYVQQRLWAEENPHAYAGAHNPLGMMVIFEEACHDAQTEVLTKDGWKFWADVTLDDALLTMRPDTLVAEYQKPLRLHVYDHDGPMVCYKARGADLCVTPNHEVFYTTVKLKGKYRKKAISSLGETSHLMKRAILWNAPDVDMFTIPAVKTLRKAYPERTVPMDVWLDFLGWYLSEGRLVHGAKGVRGFGITNYDPEVIEHLKRIMTSFGLSPKVYSVGKGWQVIADSPQMGRLLESYGVGSHNVFVPAYVAQCSTRQIRLFLDAYRDGDGYRKNKAEVIYTTSERMAGGLQELYLKLGMVCSQTKRSTAGNRSFIVGHGAQSAGGGYVIRAAKETHLKYLPSKSSQKHYTGKVYCAEVPNHLLLTRRNGYALWSGNSGIPTPIWDVAQGFFTEPVLHRYHFAFSNPRSNRGAFFECFHKNRDFWSTRSLDSREVEETDHTGFELWMRQHGADSDFMRTEVYGQFPEQSENQFISAADVRAAMAREVEPDDGAALIMGVDVARAGNDKSVVRFRQGRDGRSRKPHEFRIPDNMQLAYRLAELIEHHKPDAVCIDAGGGQGVIDRLRELGFVIIEVNFGSSPDDKVYANKRVEMWARVRDNLPSMALDDCPALLDDLTAPERKYTERSDLIMLESKESMRARGLHSPDHGDALALTFAVKVPRRDVTVSRALRGRAVKVNMGHEKLRANRRP